MGRLVSSPFLEQEAPASTPKRLGPSADPWVHVVREEEILSGRGKSREEGIPQQLKMAMEWRSG